MTAPFDVDALWSLARIGEPSLSPDGGSAVAAVTRHDMEANRSRSSLWLFSTLGEAARRLTECGEHDAQPAWSPDGSQIAFIARREQDGVKDEQAQLYLLPVGEGGGEARRATQFATGVTAFRWFPDGRRIAFIAWVWPGSLAEQGKRMAAWKARKETAYVTEQAQYRHWDHALPMEREPKLFELTVASGRVRALMAQTPLSLDWKEPGANSFCISPDGRRIAFACDPAERKRSDQPFALAELDVKTGAVQMLLQDPAWDFDAPVYSHGGQHLAFVAREQGASVTAPSRLAVLDTQGQWAVLSEDWDREVEAPLRWQADDLALLFCAEDRGRRHLYRLDAQTRELHTLFEGGHAGAFDQRGGATVLLHDSLRHPPQLSVLTTDAPRRIESLNDALLARHRFGEQREVWITGANGDPVQLWLSFPPGFDAKKDPKKKWPVMQVIHGGPHTAFGDSWHWRWNHQVFAASGRVVACVNYHGSSSFGHAFKDSISGRWGELELQDVEAASDWLLQQRWCDPKRLSATGGSYGGYMVALMNGSLAPGRYCAYVCHAGCFDWQAMYAADSYAWFPRELQAQYWESPERVAAQSPSSRAAGLSTPTLVIHGQLDYRVPDAQGLAYYNTLQARGVPSRLVWFPDENHWVLKPRNSRLWYGEFLGWLARHEAGAGGKSQAGQPVRRVPAKTRRS